MQNLRIAVVTCQAPLGQIEANLKRVRYWVRKARGVDLVCFPELNITGYGNTSLLADSAVTIPGPVTDRLLQIAKDHQMVVLAGMAERQSSGRPYATHTICFPDGRLQTYRKLHLGPPEKATFCAGDTIPVFSIGSTCIGIQLCYDAHFPELSAAMRSKGAEVIFVPHASPNGTPAEKNRSWMRHLAARAFDNSVYVVACNQAGENGDGLRFPGNALVIDPSGHAIARGTHRRPSMLTLELTAEALNAVRNHPMRHFFPNRRPGLYKTTKIT